MTRGKELISILSWLPNRSRTLALPITVLFIAVVYAAIAAGFHTVMAETFFCRFLLFFHQIMFFTTKNTIGDGGSTAL